jgi:hypothetical protein
VSTEPDTPTPAVSGTGVTSPGVGIGTAPRAQAAAAAAGEVSPEAGAAAAAAAGAEATTRVPIDAPAEPAGLSGPAKVLAMLQDPAHPEREVGAVFAGAFVLAQILRRVR